MKVPAKTAGIVIGLALLVAAIDQTIKGLVVGALAHGESRPLLPGLLDLTHQQNTGIALSLLQDKPIAVILLLNLIVLGIFVGLVLPYLRTRVGQVAAVLVFGGALGNIVDRVRVQYVVDYIDVHFWPVFNFADICVVVGILLMIGLLLVVGDQDGRTKNVPGGEPQ